MHNAQVSSYQAYSRLSLSNSEQEPATTQSTIHTCSTPRPQQQTKQPSWSNSKHWWAYNSVTLLEKNWSSATYLLLQLSERSEQWAFDARWNLKHPDTFNETLATGGLEAFFVCMALHYMWILVEKSLEFDTVRWNHTAWEQLSTNTCYYTPSRFSCVNAIRTGSSFGGWSSSWLVEHSDSFILRSAYDNYVNS